MNHKIAILMGSESDRETLQGAADLLKSFSIPYEWSVISAHRTSAYLHDYVQRAKENGICLFIAAAGGAAHLAGVVASLTELPVIGVPVQTSALGGLDSLLSTVQMPGGIPVATMGIGSSGAKNAALFAVSILALQDNELQIALKEYRTRQSEKLISDSKKSKEIYQP